MVKAPKFNFSTILDALIETLFEDVMTPLLNYQLVPSFEPPELTIVIF
jgi:hypothetical protein